MIFLINNNRLINLNISKNIEFKLLYKFITIIAFFFPNVSIMLILLKLEL